MKKLKQYILLIAICIFLQNTYAQNCLSLEWLINSTGDDWDVVCDMITDKDGSTYLAGNFTASTKLNENSKKLTGDNNIFIAKFNTNGENVWLRQINSTEYCYIASISADLSGSIYLCGNFRGEININTQILISGRSKNAFIIKMDNKGDFVWSKQINGNFLNNKLFLINDSEDNLIFTGSFTGLLNIDSTTYKSKYYTDILIAKFNDKSELITSKVFKGKANDLVKDIVINKKNEIFLTGSFEKELRVGNIVLKSQGRKDAFFIKLDNNLQVIFSKQIGGVYDDYGQNISIDSKDNILLAGSFSDEIHLSKEHYLISNGNLDVFLIKFDETNKIIWTESFGGLANDYQSSIAINALNNIYLAGTFRGEIQQKDYIVSSTEFSSDIFLTKYDANGDFRFIESFGDTNTDFGKKLIIDTANYIYLAGNFTRFLKIIEEETKNARAEDFFLSKLYDCDAAIKIYLPADTSLCGESFLIVADSNFVEYLWNGKPGSNELKIDSTGFYTIEAIDEQGCVSMDTIIVNLFLIPTFDLGDTIYAIKGEVITIDAPEGMEEYLWNDGTRLSFLNINTALLEAGNYNYSVEIEDENSCPATDDITLIVLDNMVFTDDLIFKDNSEETLNADVENGGGEMIVKVFPNPTINLLFIKIVNSDQSEYLLKIETTKGKNVLSEMIVINKKPYSKSINVSNFERGTYVVSISNKKVSFIKKIIIL